VVAFVVLVDDDEVVELVAKAETVRNKPMTNNLALSLRVKNLIMPKDDAAARDENGRNGKETDDERRVLAQDVVGLLVLLAKVLCG